MVVTKETDVRPWIGHTILISNYGRLGSVSCKVESANHRRAAVFTGIAICGVVDGGRTYIGLTYGVETVTILGNGDGYAA